MTETTIYQVVRDAVKLLPKGKVRANLGRVARMINYKNLNRTPAV